MRKLLAVSLFLLLALPAFAATPYLTANLTGGALGGGIGFDLGDNRAIDFSFTGASGNSGQTGSFYGDYCIGNWGAGITAKKTSVDVPLTYDLTLQFALEQAINEKVSVGVCFTVIDYDTAAGADPNLFFLNGIMPYFKLAF